MDIHADPEIFMDIHVDSLDVQGYQMSKGFLGYRDADSHDVHGDPCR